MDLHKDLQVYDEDHILVYLRMDQLQVILKVIQEAISLVSNLTVFALVQKEFCYLELFILPKVMVYIFQQVILKSNQMAFYEVLLVIQLGQTLAIAQLEYFKTHFVNFRDRQVNFEGQKAYFQVQKAYFQVQKVYFQVQKQVQNLVIDQEVSFLGQILGHLEYFIMEFIVLVIAIQVHISY